MIEFEDDKNELLMIVIEKFSCKQMTLYDLIDEFVFFKSKNDKFSLKIDINTQNITIYDNGYAIGYLSKFNMDKGYTNIDPSIHKRILEYVIFHIREKEDIVYEIKTRLNSLVAFEKYEEAVHIREFLKLITD